MPEVLFKVCLPGAPSCSSWRSSLPRCLRSSSRSAAGGSIFSGPEVHVVMVPEGLFKIATEGPPGHRAGGPLQYLLGAVSSIGGPEGLMIIVPEALLKLGWPKVRSSSAGGPELQCRRSSSRSACRRFHHLRAGGPHVRRSSQELLGIGSIISDPGVLMTQCRRSSSRAAWRRFHHLRAGGPHDHSA